MQCKLNSWTGSSSYKERTIWTDFSLAKCTKKEYIYIYIYFQFHSELYLSQVYLSQILFVLQSLPLAPQNCLFIYLFTMCDLLFDFICVCVYVCVCVCVCVLQKDPQKIKYLQFCDFCKGYKAPRSHHCRKCDRWEIFPLPSQDVPSSLHYCNPCSEKNLCCLKLIMFLTNKNSRTRRQEMSWLASVSVYTIDSIVSVL